MKKKRRKQNIDRFLKLKEANSIFGQAHLRWRVGLEEVETEGGSLRSNTMRTWVRNFRTDIVLQVDSQFLWMQLYFLQDLQWILYNPSVTLPVEIVWLCDFIKKEKLRYYQKSCHSCCNNSGSGFQVMYLHHNPIMKIGSLPDKMFSLGMTAITCFLLFLIHLHSLVDCMFAAALIIMYQKNISFDTSNWVGEHWTERQITFRCLEKP